MCGNIRHVSGKIHPTQSGSSSGVNCLDQNDEILRRSRQAKFRPKYMT